MTIIENFREKIKYLSMNRLFAIIMLTIVVAVGSFAIGYIVASKKREPLSISFNEAVSRMSKASQLSSVVMASKLGKYYYFPWCREYQVLSAKNLVTFNTWQEAEQAGYVIGKDCPAPEQQK